MVLSTPSQSCNKTTVRFRVNTVEPLPLAPLAQFGIPGVPFIIANPVTPEFSQGEDVVADAIFRIDGQPVLPASWNITVVVKNSQFAILKTWQGLLNNGLYYKPDIDQYEFWIPGAVTADLFAGTYFVDCVATEPVGSGPGGRNRTILLTTVAFDLKYTVSSPHPDSADTRRPGRINHDCQEPTAPIGVNPLRPSL